MSSIARSRAFVTSREFSPIRMKASPRTASPLPSAVTPPRRMAWPMSHLGHVPDADRDAVVGLDHDVLDLLDGRGPGDPLDEARLARADDVAAAHVLVVLPQGPREVVEREAVLGELRRVGLDLELLLVARPRR